MMNKNETPKKDGRGGARIGSGPKKKSPAEKKVQLSVSLSPDIVTVIKATNESPSKLIQQLLRDYFNKNGE